MYIIQTHIVCICTYPKAVRIWAVEIEQRCLHQRKRKSGIILEMRKERYKNIKILLKLQNIIPANFHHHGIEFYLWSTAYEFTDCEGSFLRDQKS